jgi:molecular chaperone DnaK (HSP70)
MEERKRSLTIKKTIEEPVITDPERQYGGPQSGLPPPFEVGSELAPYLIVGMDFGTNYCRVSTFTKGAAHPVNPHQFRALVEDVLGVEVDGLHLVHSLKNCISDNYLIKQYDRVYTCTEITSMFLSKIKERIEQYNARLLAKAVIGVPACFTHRQRETLIHATKEAGIGVLGLINEPTAALLDACYSANLKNGKFLVVSSGVYSFEIMIAHVQNGLVETKAVCGSREISGRSITCALTHAIRTEFETDKPEELYTAVDRAKAELDKRGYASLSIENHKKSYTFDRKKCEQWLSGYSETVGSLIESVMKEACCQPNEINYIVLSGDSTKLWLLQEILSVRLSRAKQVTGSIASGAATYAALSARQTKDWVLWDSIADPVLVAQGSHVCEVIAGNSPLPINGHAAIAPDDDGKTLAVVLQKSKDREGDVVHVASVRVVEELRHVESSLVDLSVTATADGTLSFTSRHKGLDLNLTVEVVQPELSEPTLVDLTPTDLRPDEAKESFDPGFTLKRYGKRWLVHSVVEGSSASLAGVIVFDELLCEDYELRFICNQSLAVLKCELNEQIKLVFKRHANIYSGEFVCQSSSNRLSRERLKTTIADSFLNSDYRSLVTALLDYVEYCINVFQQSESEEAEKMLVRAKKIADEEFEPEDMLALRGLCNACVLSASYAIALKGGKNAIASAFFACEQIEAWLKSASLLPAEAVRYLCDAAVAMGALKEYADTKKQVETLVQHAFALDTRHQVPAEFWTDFATRLPGARIIMPESHQESTRELWELMLKASDSSARQEILSLLRVAVPSGLVAFDENARRLAFDIACAYKLHADWWLRHEAAGTPVDDELRSSMETMCHDLRISPCASAKEAYDFARTILEFLDLRASEINDNNAEASYNSILAAVFAGLGAHMDVERAANVVARLTGAGATCAHDTVGGVCELYFACKNYRQVQNFCSRQTTRLDFNNPRHSEQIEAALLYLSEACSKLDDFSPGKVAYKRMLEVCVRNEAVRFRISILYTEFLMRTDDYEAERQLLSTADLGKKLGLIKDENVAKWTERLRELRGNRDFLKRPKNG